MLVSDIIVYISLAHETLRNKIQDQFNLVFHLMSCFTQKCITWFKCVVNAVSHCWKRSWLILGFPCFLSVTCSETAVRSEEQNTADVANLSFYSLLQPFLHTSQLITHSFAISGIRFILNVGGIRCRPPNDFPSYS